MSQAVNSILASIVSVVSLSISALNFGLAKRAEKKRSMTEAINVQLQIDRLCGLAFDNLYGPGGFEETKLHDKWGQAQDLVNQALRLNPKSAKVIRYQGMLQEAMDNHTGAAERYRTAIRYDPHYGAAYAGLGRLIGGAEGLQYLEKALECDPQDAWACYWLADALQKSGSGRFLEYLKRAEALHSKDQSLLVRCARCADAAGMPKEVKRLFSKVVALNKNNVDALVGLGRIAIEANKWEEGLMWIEDAVRANPTDSYPYAMVAAIYADQGNAAKSLEYCQKAVKIDPSRRIEGDNLQEMAVAMQALLRTQSALDVLRQTPAMLPLLNDA